MKLDYIRHCDCLDGLKDLPDKCIDLTVTSPPYDNLRTYNGFSFDFEGIAKELYRVTKDGGVVVWIVADATVNGSETGTSFRQALYFKETGFNLHDTMIWEKPSLTFPNRYRYWQSFEYMFVLSKGKPKSVNKIMDRKNKRAGEKIHGTSRNPDGTTFVKSGTKKGTVIKEYGERKNVWNISPEMSNKKRMHPAQFPEALAKDHIISWSDEGDVVLDCFMGSGTTAVSAIHTNRHWIGFEISDEYCEIARRRIDDESRDSFQTSIFE